MFDESMSTERAVVARRLEAFVEDFALQSEGAGWPRIAGKILAYLLVSPQAAQSMEDLQRALGISKASASSMTRFLLQLGFLERTSQRGNRKTLFRVADGVWGRLLQARLQSVAPFRALAEEANGLLAGRREAETARIREMTRFYQWWDNETRALWQRWQVHQRGERRGEGAGDLPKG